MSDVETAQTGAPAENQTQPAPTATEQPVEGVQQETEQTEQPRDEQGKFKKDGAQQRINELTFKYRQTERELEAARQRAQELEARVQAQQSAPEPSQGAPTLEQYNWDMDAWGKALAAHNQANLDRLLSQRISEQQTQQHRQRAAQNFESRAAQYAAENPEFNDRVARLSATVQFPDEIVEAVSLSDHGPAIADHLAMHLDEADRISRMPIHLAAMELARIEAKVSAPKPKPVSNAPAPAATLGGGSTPVKTPENMTTAEWMAWRQKQISR